MRLYQFKVKQKKNIYLKFLDVQINVRQIKYKLIVNKRKINQKNFKDAGKHDDL
jgi:hypothetical protein